MAQRSSTVKLRPCTEGAASKNLLLKMLHKNVQRHHRGSLYTIGDAKDFCRSLAHEALPEANDKEQMPLTTLFNRVSEANAQPFLSQPDFRDSATVLRTLNFVIASFGTHANRSILWQELGVLVRSTVLKNLVHCQIYKFTNEWRDCGIHVGRHSCSRQCVFTCAGIWPPDGSKAMST